MHQIILYNTSHMILIYLQLYKRILSDIGGHIPKEKKKIEALKTYMFVKLLNENLKNQINLKKMKL